MVFCCDFSLTNEDMEKISALDNGQSVFLSHTEPATVEWFVSMVEERRGK